MDFESGHIYHIFNQGNDRKPIFFKPENYLFFLNKIKTHIAPYADILAWCLMPNHFHLMVHLNTHHMETHRVTLSHPVSTQAVNKTQTFNLSIATLLRSYTRAINIQEDKTGSLFREGTKAECLTRIDGLTPSFYNTEFGTKINISNPEKEYPQICFNYIHNNPVKAGLVKQPQDWEFSSYRDYCGLRNGKLVNKSRAKEFGLHCTTDE